MASRCPRRRAAFLWLASVTAGCAQPVPYACGEAGDDPVAYETDRAYRREVLERDMTTLASDYAQLRFRKYAVQGKWDSLPERDPPTRPFTVEDQADLMAGRPLRGVPASARPLSEAATPDRCSAWEDLGERVFFEYPIRNDPTLAAVAAAGALDDVGFVEADGAFVGIRVTETPKGEPVLARTCAMCHASLDEHGEVSAVRSNRDIDLGALGLFAANLDLPVISELETTEVDLLSELGPGRADVLDDHLFDPYALPDLGGLGDLPLLHHNGNWTHTGVATLAVRCETLFITTLDERARIPRSLSWAIAEYFEGLPPSEPLQAPSKLSRQGEAVFEAEGCSGCHEPPFFTSDERIEVAEIGTDPLAASSRARFSGGYRVPSLRGVGRHAPYLHHGAVPDLEGMFDPARTEPGHRYGLELDPGERQALLAWLRSI